MSTDTRKWSCPECGSTVEISIFQLDPLACDACLAKRKAKKGGSSSRAATQSSSLPSAPPSSTATDSPPPVAESASPASASSVVGAARRFAVPLAVGVLVGLVLGFAGGRLTAPSRSEQSGSAQAGSRPEAKSASKPGGRSDTADSGNGGATGDGTSASKANPDAAPAAAKAQPFDERPDESTRPGPNYKWVKGYTRKDGVRVKGHWAKDSKK